jgi:hypothetical protein
VQSQQSEAFLQEDKEVMKTLDGKLKERDSVMELGVAEIIRKSIELRDGQNPEVRTFLFHCSTATCPLYELRIDYWNPNLSYL